MESLNVASHSPNALALSGALVAGLVSGGHFAQQALDFLHVFVAAPFASTHQYDKKPLVLRRGQGAFA